MLTPHCAWTDPGIDLALLLGLAPLASPNFSLPAISAVIAAIMPVALLMGPFLFNPRCFEPGLALADFRSWLVWLIEPKGWAAHHKSLLQKKEGSAAYALIMPSKEALLAFPLLLLSHEALRQQTSSTIPWHLPVLAAVALPVVPLIVVGLVLLVLSPICSAQKHTDARITHWMAALCAIVLAGEVATLALFAPSLLTAQWTAIVATRYFSWRALLNALGYLSTRRASGCDGGPIGRALLGWGALTTAALGLLCDFILGLALQLPVLLLAALPCASPIHLSCLFFSTRKRLAAAQELSSGRLNAEEYKELMSKHRDQTKRDEERASRETEERRKERLKKLKTGANKAVAAERTRRETEVQRNDATASAASPEPTTTLAAGQANSGAEGKAVPSPTPVKAKPKGRIGRRHSAPPTAINTPAPPMVVQGAWVVDAPGPTPAAVDASVETATEVQGLDANNVVVSVDVPALAAQSAPAASNNPNLSDRLAQLFSPSGADEPKAVASASKELDIMEA